MLNGTQVSTALALAAVFRTENVLICSGTRWPVHMSTDAMKGSDTPVRPCASSNVRGHSGQARSRSATVLRELMHDSEIRASHLRIATMCRTRIPFAASRQVVGRVPRRRCGTSCAVLETEANAVTDNPLVFVEH